MTIVQQGAINPTAQIVPDIIVQIIPPTVALLNGVPTNILGLVGTATWGPVNSPSIVSSMADYSRQFGQIQARKYDLGTAVAAAVLQGANNIRAVRVTDGTDVAATIGLFDTAGTPVLGATLNALYTGSLGNLLIALVAAGSTPNTSKLTLALPGQTPEVFDNLGGVTATATVQTTANVVTGTTLTNNGGSGYNPAAPAPIVTVGGPGVGAQIVALVNPNGTLSLTVAAGGTGYTTPPTITIPAPANNVWQNLVSAVNNGISGLRGPSQFVTAAIGTSTGVPAVATYTLAGGTDGVTTITGATLLGVDTVPRKGMYALRGTQTSIAALADDDDSTTFSAQVAYGLSEGTYMVMTGPVGQTIAAAITAKNAAGIDTYAAKLMLGDWCYFNDTVNNQRRLISPQGYVAGILANLSPEQSSLNKQLQGILGTQKSSLNQTYSSADLQQLVGAGIDVIANPVPGGNYFGVRVGHNTSSNAVINGDNYTRMTNYIASTLNGGMGKYVGRLQSPDERSQARTTLQSFLQSLQDQNMIGDVNNPGKPAYSVILDATNNPNNRVALGFQQADVKVVYLSIVEKFLINLEPGQSVQITRGSTALAA